MTANRHSGVSVSVVLRHLRGSFTEGKDSAQGDSASDSLSSQRLDFHPCEFVGIVVTVSCQRHQLSIRVLLVRFQVGKPKKPNKIKPL
jgi:hypothetical protein